MMIRNVLSKASRLCVPVRYCNSDLNNPQPPVERPENKTIGTNLLINRVYITTGTAILTCIGSTYMANTLPYLVVNPFVCFGIGGLLSVAGFVSSWYIKPEQLTIYDDDKAYIKTANPPIRLGLYGMGCIGLGIFFLPFANMISAFSPYFLANLTALTVGTFGGATLFKTLFPKTQLFNRIGLVGGSIGGFLMMHLANHTISTIYGANFLSNWVQTIDTYVGIVVFLFSVAYNARLSREEYEQGRADHLAISIRFFKDFFAFIKRVIISMFKSSTKTK